MNKLDIGIIASSDININKCGVYKYSESESFVLRAFGYAVDDGEIKVVDIAGGEEIPNEIIKALLDDSVIKWAFDAQYNRVCLARYLNVDILPYSWKCTMIWSAASGLTFSLNNICSRLRIPICFNGSVDKILKNTISSSMAIQRNLSSYPLSESEWVNYRIDQEINDRGVALDMNLVNNANYIIKSNDLCKSLKLKKYSAMPSVVCDDGRARGLFLFYGAARTARFSGRYIQPHNLPRTHSDNLDDLRKRLELRDENLSEDNLSELIRTVFIPKKGCRFIVADFSSIEARILAWLSGENWKLNAFRNHQDVYCITSSKIFGKIVVKGGINGELRDIGKKLELTLGYGGTERALKASGLVDMGIAESELKNIVQKWNAENSNIVKYWSDVNHAFMSVILDKKVTNCECTVGKVKFVWHGKSKIVAVILPSGRLLIYQNPFISKQKFGPHVAYYEGDEIKHTNPPTLVQHIVQGTARDILTDSIRRLTDMNLKIVMHVHDEVVIEAPNGQFSADQICRIISKSPQWASDLPLGAEGFECEYYRKN